MAAFLLVLQDEAGRCIVGHTIPTWDGPILATENFFYTAQMLGLPEQATVEDFAKAGERYCSTSWDEIQRRYLGKKTVKELLKYCFSTAHIVALLTDGLGVDPKEQRVRFSNTLLHRSDTMQDCLRRRRISVEDAANGLMREGSANISTVAWVEQGRPPPLPGEHMSWCYQACVACSL
eukprot:scaffold80177_cov41-Prasinocladus_malaysianus.AAC.1